ncbi:MAG: hypothetical protein HRU06_18305 [Oceanospirillaceae bacterium]|nr:hypothetical protein [Oceanospirillaceae bacterium]
MDFSKNNLGVSSAKQALTKTVTRQIVMVEKLTLSLAEKVQEFYEEEIDTKYVESAKLDSKILLHTKRDPNSAAIRELSLEKDELDQLIKPHQEGNRAILDNVVDLLIESKNTRRHFEIILGTLLLNYPIDKKDINFDKRNEINKVLRPIYQSALMSLLVEKLLLEGFSFKSDFLADLLLPFKGSDNSEEEQEQALIALQKLMVEIIYLKEMGFCSPKSLEVLTRSGENDLLDQQNRDVLRAQSVIDSKAFHHYGVGALTIKPNKVKPVVATSSAEKKLPTSQVKAMEEKRQQRYQAEVIKAERTAQMMQAARFAFIKDVMDSHPEELSEIDELLKVCQVYTSFMLSVKGNVDKELNIKAYDVMQKQAKENKLNRLFTDTLLAMMGRFPIGSGIYFLDLRRHANEFGSIDKAIVTGLNPQDPDEPEVKRVTTKYKYKLDSGTVRVSKRINLYFEEAREAKSFTYKLQIRFKTQFESEDKELFYSFRANDAFRTLSVSEFKLW